MNNIFISWDEYNEMIHKISQQIFMEEFDGIYGVPRGGLVMAVSLSHTLGLPILLYPTEESLVVDDISDTGKTLQSLPHKKIACLFSTPWTKTKPDIHIRTKLNKNDWIIFSWEKL
jgi:hypoxanthine phosphoribosyltransferase